MSTKDLADQLREVKALHAGVMVSIITIFRECYEEGTPEDRLRIIANDLCRSTADMDDDEAHNVIWQALVREADIRESFAAAGGVAHCLKALRYRVYELERGWKSLEAAIKDRGQP